MRCPPALWSVCVVVLVSLVLAGGLSAQQIDGPVILQNAATSNGTGVQQRVRGMTAVSVQLIVAGGFDGTLNWETSQDTSTYVAVLCRNTATSAVASTATAAGRYLCNIAGSERFQARISGRTVGSATVVGQFSGATPAGDFGQGMLSERAAPLTDVNVAQIGGSAFAQGQRVSGSSLSMVLSSDHGGLPTGTNLIGKMGIDQTTPGTTNAIATIAGQNGVEGNTGLVTALTQRVVQAGGVVTLQASQVAATANGTTTRTTTTGLAAYRDLDTLINITAGGAATGMLQLFLQDSPDGGTTWDDVVASNVFAFGSAPTTQRFIVSGRIASTVIQGSAAATEMLTAGTVRNGPWGDRIRVREVVSGISGSPTGPTYTITAVAK